MLSLSIIKTKYLFDLKVERGFLFKDTCKVLHERRYDYTGKITLESATCK